MPASSRSPAFFFFGPLLELGKIALGKEGGKNIRKTFLVFVGDKTGCFF